MLIDLDNISFGNPCVEHFSILSEQNYLDYLTKDLTTYTFPKNSSATARQELEMIVDNISQIADKEEIYNRFINYDKGIIAFFNSYLNADGTQQELMNIIHSLVEDTSPLIYKLKFYFARPRPGQLAYFYKLKLFPYRSTTSDCPSYPSAHAYFATIITRVLSNLVPENTKDFTDVCQDICDSRVFLGLNYLSDIEAGIIAAEKVLANQEFKIKYKQ